MNFGKNKREEPEALGVKNTPEESHEPTADAHKDDESDGIYVMEALSEKGERKVTPDELTKLMNHTVDALVSHGKMRTRKEMEEELEGEFKIDIVTGEPFESKVMEIAIKNAMEYFDIKIKHLDGYKKS